LTGIALTALAGVSRPAFWSVQSARHSRNVQDKEMMVKHMHSAALIAALVLLPGAAAAQLSTPADWKWRQDAPAPLAPGAAMTPGSWVFVRMPPGWHITTGPGVLLYPTAHGDADGNFSIEAEIFLFPGESLEEYGVFAGSKDIEAGDPSYTAFVLRRDGRAAILQRRGARTTAVADWQARDAILRGTGGGGEPVKNVLRVDVTASAVAMSVNGVQVGTVPRQDVAVDGRFGFRVGKDMNLHISTLNVTRRLAPAPVKKD
jgi:hypothetical protein